MQPTERIQQAEAPAGRRPSRAGPLLAHGAVLLLRALAIVVIAAPVLLAVGLLLR